MRSGALPVRLLVGGLRARARLHAAVLVATALTVAAAVIGPVYALAAQESILQDTLRSAPVSSTGLHFTVSASPYDPTVSPDLFDLVEHDAPRPVPKLGFPTIVPGITLARHVRVSALAGRQPSRLVWRKGDCAHLTVVSGHCPAAPGEAMVSQRTVRDGGPGWRLGAIVDLGLPKPARVVGVYRPRSAADPFWFGADYFDGGVRGSNDQAVLAVDSIFVARAEFDALPTGTGVSGVLDYPLDPAKVRLGTRAAVLAEVASIRRDTTGSHLALHTALSRVLATADRQRGYVEQAARLVALQLVLLGCVVLFFVTLDLTEGRRREIALARLRGQPSSSVIWFALGEQLLVLVLALPVGLAAGFVAGVLLSAAVLLPGTPIALPPSAVGAAGLALLGAVAAAALSARRVLGRSVLEQWRRTASRPRRRPLTVLGRGGAALAAVGGVVLLLRAGGTGVTPLLVLAPVLLLACVAALGAPVLPWAARRAAPASRASSRIAPFLVARRIGRGRGTLRAATLLIVTVGLAAFAVAGESVLAGNRTARADAEVGATRLVDVEYDGQVDPVEAVRSADPDGRWAMAVARWLPDGGSSVAGTVLGVEPDRYTAVALPARGGADAGAVAAAVASRSVPDVRVSATRLTATLTVQDLAGNVAPHVELVLRTRNGRTLQPDAGALREGTHAYAAPVACASGCSFVGFFWTRPVLATTTLRGTVTVRSVAGELGGRAVRVPVRIADPTAWRASVPVSESTDRVTGGPGGPTDAFSTASGYAGLAYASVPASLRAVVSPHGLLDERPPSGWAVVDAFGATVPFHVTARTGMLPGVLDAGVVTDVRALERSSASFADEAFWQVWLGPAAPPDALQRLRHAGLILGPARTVAAREGELAREGPALAFALLTALALAAAVLAVLATAVAAGAVARAGAAEAAAMRLIGVGRRSLAVAAALEQALLVAGAALLGIPTGALAVALVVPRVPETASRSPVALEYVPQPGPVVWFLVAFAAAVLGVALLGAAQVLRTSGPQRLREVEA